MTYKNRYQKYPEIVDKLDKLKIMILSMSGLDPTDKIDFDLDWSNSTKEVFGLYIYVSNSFEINGFFSEIQEEIYGIQTKLSNIFKKVKIDKNLNISRNVKNYLSSDCILSNLNYKSNDGEFTFEIGFMLEIF